MVKLLDSVLTPDGIVTFTFVASVTPSLSNPLGLTSLSSLLATLGGGQFEWLQFCTSYDGRPLNDAHGNPIPSPPPAYVDPPDGGYGAPDYLWGDTDPWYWDDQPDPAGDPIESTTHTHDATGQSDMSDQPGNRAGVHDEFDTFLVIDHGDGTYDVIAGFHWGGDFGSSGHITDNQVLTAGNTLTLDEQSAISKFLHTTGTGSTTPYTNRNPVIMPAPSDPFNPISILDGPPNLVFARSESGVLVIDSLSVWNLQGKL